MKVIELQRTCDCCPAQWEGRLEDGRYIYIRFRYSRLQVGIGSTFHEAVNVICYDHVSGEYLEWLEPGDDWNGEMELPEVAEHMPTIDFSAVLGTKATMIAGRSRFFMSVPSGAIGRTR